MLTMPDARFLHTIPTEDPHLPGEDRYHSSHHPLDPDAVITAESQEEDRMLPTTSMIVCSLRRRVDSSSHKHEQWTSII